MIAPKKTYDPPINPIAIVAEGQLISQWHDLILPVLISPLLKIGSMLEWYYYDDKEAIVKKHYMIYIGNHMIVHLAIKVVHDEQGNEIKVSRRSIKFKKYQFLLACRLGIG